MSPVFRIFLVMQLLLHQEALSCHDWEYEINGECCPKCGAGFRVSKHCTVGSSTSCVPCSERTYTDRSNGLIKCFRCQVCDPGAHLEVKEECTYIKNTVCTCKPGYFCNHWMDERSCEMCTEHTISPPGYMVTQPGTATSDTQFVPCPPGTFSKTEMSFSCEQWTNCSKEGLTEVQSGSTSSDAVCEHPKSPNMTVVLLSTGLVAGLVIVLTVAMILFKLKKCTTKGAATEQKQEQKGDYIPVQESNNMGIPMQETTQNLGEPSFWTSA